ncbi:hypothetical protein B0H67DRAFT_558443 [Lasiosphaeris hirsuta]|uniref:Uncharacterized protein n=1 Tax=Lasiosphaeris hirsuta TaxID=260670 RepID=A0AA39ZSH0_9PEZI|nr:hypothetical protein B0H67DRAFT_558443 [Lasiosphaeris hirsuta]
MQAQIGQCRSFIDTSLLFAVIFLNCMSLNGRVGMVLTFNTKRQVFERSYCPSLVFVSEANGQAGMYPTKRIPAFTGNDFYHKPLGASVNRKPIVIRMEGILEAVYKHAISDKRAAWKLDYDSGFLVLRPEIPSHGNILPPIMLHWRAGGGFSWKFLDILQDLGAMLEKDVTAVSTIKQHASHAYGIQATIC